MIARLAFSTATHMQPDILLVDEVLSVGDAEFKKKSLKKIKAMANSGTTIIFVSHDPGATLDLCRHGILLNEGRILEMGEINEVMDAYDTLTAKGVNPAEFGDNVDQQDQQEQQEQDETKGPKRSYKVWMNHRNAPQNETVCLKELYVKPKNGDFRDEIHIDDEIELQVKFIKKTDGETLDVAIQLIDEDANMIFEHGSVLCENSLNRMPRGNYVAKCCIPSHLLNAGHYAINLVFYQDRMKLMTFKLINAVILRIVPPVEQFEDEYIGTFGPIRPNLKWEVLQDTYPFF